VNLKNLKQKNNPLPVFDVLYKRMDDFGRTMPMLTDLRDESMRERHWDALRLEVKEEF
jgi:dynein heavy chain